MLTIPHLFEMLEAAALTSSNVFLLRMFGSIVSGGNHGARCASLPPESDSTNESSTELTCAGGAHPAQLSRADRRFALRGVPACDFTNAMSSFQISKLFAKGFVHATAPAPDPTEHLDPCSSSVFWGRTAVVRRLHPTDAMLRMGAITGIVAVISACPAFARAAWELVSLQADDPEDPIHPPKSLPFADDLPVPKLVVPPVRRGSAIYGMLGWTPVGGIGLEGVHRLGSMFEITAGLGIGRNAVDPAAEKLGIGNPVQGAVMPRLRLGSDTKALTLGVGISGGNYADLSTCGWDFECRQSTIYRLDTCCGEISRSVASIGRPADSPFVTSLVTVPC